LSCTCHKAIFLSREEAVDANRRSGGGKRPYPCPLDSKFWHLASSRKYRRRRR
jgi:hypothetical protein